MNFNIFIITKKLIITNNEKRAISVFRLSLEANKVFKENKSYRQVPLF